ncbi:MAG: hypothetical protein ABIG69_11880 [Bacteroidota bacterium]
MKRIITFVGVLLAMNCLVVESYNYEKQLNYTQLPFVVNYTINLTSGNNVSYLNFSTSARFLNITKKNTVLYNGTVYRLNVSINVPKYTLPKTYIESVYIRKNSSSTITNITFYLNIIDDTVIDVWYLMDLNHYAIERCGYSLPYNTTYDIVIRGKAYQNITVNYTNYVKGIRNVTLGYNNYTTLRVNISLPQSLGVGLHYSSVRFSMNITNNFFNFSFIIKDCEAPPIDIYKYMQDCREKATWNEYTDCMQGLYNDLMELNKTKIINETIYENITTVQYVDMITIDDKAVLENLLNKIKNYNDKIDNLITANNDLRTQNIRLNDEIAIKANEIVNSAVQQIKDKEERRDIILGYVWTSVIWLFWLCLCVVPLIMYKRNKWT